jgi:glutathione S-transferase
MERFELVIGNKAYSGWSMRPWLALRHTGAAFSETRISLYVPGSKEKLLQHAPSGKVPALKHGTLTVWESMAICEYLAERFPEAQLWPTALDARAEARAVSTEMHAGFSRIREAMPFNCRVRDRHVPHTAELDREIARATELWESCRQRHAGAGPWLFGAFSIADAMFIPLALRFVTYSVPLTGKARAYVDAVWEHAPVQEWIAAARQEPEVMESNEVGK